jgi:peptidyl-prolyl cis-trans isomerase B (cyclophilin B)
MANSGQPGSTGSQFFIVYGDSQLDPNYTVLGTITGGMDVVKQVAAAGDDKAFAQQAGGGHPKKEIVINKLAMSGIQG